jgi:predicted TIM-barrel fold metal-dependent hydrolase
MLYFDAHACIGQRPFKHKRTRWSTEHLLEDMELAEISGALVSHGLAQSYDPLYGNGRLVAEIKKAPDKLFPLWCILPLGSVDFYACGEEMLRAMEETGVRAVRLVQGNYSLHEAVMGETFAALQETKTLTLLSAAWGGGDLFAFFHELLSRHPRLPVLLTDHTWSQQRHVHRLMQLHENLYIEFSAYQINRGLERYTAEFGDERLLFGTGGTEKSPGAARTFVDYAQIPPESKERIAGGNLRRLLKEQGPATAAPAQRPGDVCMADARAGRRQSTFVYDAHAHVLHEGGQGAGVNYIMYDGDAAGMLEVNAWCGIDRIAMMSWHGPVCTDAHDGNEVVWRAMQRYGDEILGVAVIDPTHMDSAQMEAEIDLRYRQQGFVGLKPYVRMNLSYEDEGFMPWWQFGNEHQLYALMHLAGHTGGVAGIGRLAARFPDMSWLIAHSGGSYAFAEEVAACICEHPNVYAELTLTPVTNRVVEYLVEATDDEHVLFGTDAPMRDPRQQLGWVLWADLPMQSKEKVLGLNFQRIVERAKKPIAT